MKKYIIGFIAGAIIFGTIGVYAATQIYARQVSYDDTTVDQALDDLYKKANERSDMKLLWTNPNPSAEFAPQTLNINLSDYKYVVITSTFGGNGLTNDYFDGHKSLIEVGTTSNITGVHGGSNGLNHSHGIAATTREVIVTTSSIEFKKGNFYNGTNNQSNNYAVPLYIWGIK